MMTFSLVAYAVIAVRAPNDHLLVATSLTAEEALSKYQATKLEYGDAISVEGGVMIDEETLIERARKALQEAQVAQNGKTVH